MITCNYKYIRFKDKNIVQEHLNSIQNLAATYGVVLVDDYNEILGIKSTYEDTKYGWLEHMLKDATICRDSCGYFIDLPKPILIRDELTDASSDNPETSTLNIVLHTNEVSDPDAALAEIFNYIHTFKDRMINLSIM